MALINEIEVKWVPPGPLDKSNPMVTFGFAIAYKCDGSHTLAIAHKALPTYGDKVIDVGIALAEAKAKLLQELTR